VLTVNVADVLPAAMLTDAGTVAAALLLDNCTETPPFGAGAVNVKVAVDVSPPVKLDGFTDTDAGVTPSVGVSESVIDEFAGITTPS
jgi:hypothetical protein